jgi:glycerol uptake facilitator-like aquaporin
MQAVRAAVAECLGTAFLVAAVVGSGIMGERLAGGNAGLALLANSLATGAALVALIFTFGPISGAHLNPAVSIALAAGGGFPWGRVPLYAVAQTLGGLLGVMAAHTMFALPLIEFSRHVRTGGSQFLSEFVATFGLVLVIHATSKRVAVVPLAVAAYITAAYWFTSSTSFANPAVTVARGLTDTFSGIAPSGILLFLLAQLLGALAATAVFRWLRAG